MLKFTRLRFKKGFTLIEVLISLFILSLFMHSLMLIYDSYNRVETEIRTDHSADFLHFITLIELELNNYIIIEIEPEIIRIENKGTHKASRIIKQNNKIYIAPGHQPLLYDVYDWQLVQIFDKLSMTVTFNNGQVFSGVITLENLEE